MIAGAEADLPIDEEACTDSKNAAKGSCWFCTFLQLLLLYAVAVVMLLSCVAHPPHVAFEWTTMTNLLEEFTVAAADLESFAHEVKDEADSLMPCEESDSSNFEQACQSGTIDTTDSTGAEREKVCHQGGTGMNKCEQGMCTALTVAAIGGTGCSWIPIAGGVCSAASKVLKIVFSAYRFTSKLSYSLAQIRFAMPHLAEAIQIIGGAYALISSAITVLAALVLSSLALIGFQKGHNQDKSLSISALLAVLLAINALAVYVEEEGLLDFTSDIQVGEFSGIMKWSGLSWCVLPLETLLLWCAGALSCSDRLWWCGWVIILAALSADVYVMLLSTTDQCALCQASVSEIQGWCARVGSLGSELADLACGPAGILDPALRKLDNLVTCPEGVDASMCESTCIISTYIAVARGILGLSTKALVVSSLSPKYLPWFGQVNRFTVLTFAGSAFSTDIANAMAKSMSGMADDVSGLIILFFWGGVLLVASGNGLPKSAREPHLPLPIILVPWLVVATRTLRDLYEILML